MRQESFFDAQSKNATTHHEVLDAVLMNPSSAGESILREVVFGVKNVKLAARSEEPVTLFEGIARVCGVELVGFVKQFKDAIHLHVFGIADTGHGYAEVQALKKFLLRQRFSHGLTL